MEPALATQLAHLGAAAMLLLGLLGLLVPGERARTASLTPVGRGGLAHLRGPQGGFLVALGAALIALQETALYALVGLAWIGSAGGRLLSFWRDGARETRNVAWLIAEAVLGWVFLGPLLAIWWREVWA